VTAALWHRYWTTVQKLVYRDYICKPVSIPADKTALLRTKSSNSATNERRLMSMKSVQQHVSNAISNLVQCVSNNSTKLRGYIISTLGASSMPVWAVSGIQRWISGVIIAEDCKGVRCPPIFSLSNLIAGTNRKAYLLHASFALKDSHCQWSSITDFTVVQQLMPEHLHTYELS